MSVRLMAAVIDSDLEGSERWVAMMLADHGDHAGEHIYPSIDKLVWMTKLSRSTVTKARKRLVEMGVLAVVREGGGRANTTEYRFDVDALPKRRPWHQERAEKQRVRETDGFRKGPIEAEKGPIDAQKGSAHRTRTVIEPSEGTNDTQSAGADGARGEVIEMSMVEATKLARLLSDCARASRGVPPQSPQFKPTKGGTEAIERLHRIDGVAFEEIAAFIRWLYESDSERAAFWRANILSGEKLRKQFFRVRDEAAREQQQDGGLLAFLSPEGWDRVRSGGR